MSGEEEQVIRLSPSLSLPPLTIGLACVEDVTNQQSNTIVRHLESDITARIRTTMTLDDLKDDPIIRSYRDFYWRTVRVDPTKIRPAAEALIRRILQGKTLPRISTLVDTYNLLSVETRVSFGGYDASTISLPLLLRPANDEELFYGIGMEHPIKLSKDMLVLADATQSLCVYPYRDAERTRITESTRRMLLMAAGAPGISSVIIHDALEKSVRQIIRTVGGKLGIFSVILLGEP